MNARATALELSYKEAELHAVFASENVAFFAEQELAIRTLREIESKVKASALAAYAADPTDKHPAPGITMTDGFTYDYKDDELLRWCKENMPVAIVKSVDLPKVKPLFVDPKARPDCVTATPNPGVRIASDLSKALAE
jgi:hypothetical protein